MSQTAAVGPKSRDDICLFSGWPKRPVFSIYGGEGTLLFRSRCAAFDLTDTLDRVLGTPLGYSVFGISSNSAVDRRWTEAELRQQEGNIRYDLSFDGFDVEIQRVKGAGLRCSEEALWALIVTSV